MDVVGVGESKVVDRIELFTEELLIDADDANGDLSEIRVFDITYSDTFKTDRAGQSVAGRIEFRSHDDKPNGQANWSSYGRYADMRDVRIDIARGKHPKN